MKKFILAAIAAAVVITTATLVPSTASAQAREKCVIANSHYTGWEPIWLAKQLGLLKKHGDLNNVVLDVTDPMDYLESITQFSNGQFCALAVTNMDALTGPASSGINTRFVVVGDYSNGNDGLLWRAAKRPSLSSIVGKTVILEQGSVSQYLLWRAAQIERFDYNRVTISHAAAPDILAAFKSGREGTIVVTYNPFLMSGRNEKNAHMLFDSSRIPHEIIDGIVVNDQKASANVRKAIAGAWYEAMEIINDRGSKRQADAIKWMADFAGNTVEEFNAQLRTTNLFYRREDAFRFASDAKLKATMDLVRTFAGENSFLKNGAGVEQGPDYVGIQFPDGSVVGDRNNVKLYFDTTYMK